MGRRRWSVFGCVRGVFQIHLGWVAFVGQRCTKFGIGGIRGVVVVGTPVAGIRMVVHMGDMLVGDIPVGQWKEEKAIV